MKVLGITGGVGSGKSTVLNYLQETYQVRVIQADQAAHLLQEPGRDGYQKIVAEFGERILSEDGRISRSKLGELVFAKRELLEKLNHILHPAVKQYIIEEIEQERRKGKSPFAVIEAALLIEERYDRICDEIWYIHADAAVRKMRLMQSRGYSEKKVEDIMKNQLSEEMFLAHCQFVVDNSGDFVENTYEQIDRGLVEHEFL